MICAHEKSELAECFEPLLTEENRELLGYVDDGIVKLTPITREMLFP